MIEFEGYQVGKPRRPWSVPATRLPSMSRISNGSTMRPVTNRRAGLGTQRARAAVSVKKQTAEGSSGTLDQMRMDMQCPANENAGKSPDMPRPVHSAGRNVAALHAAGLRFAGNRP